MRRVNQKQTVVTRNIHLIMFIGILVVVLSIVGIGLTLDAIK